MTSAAAVQSTSNLTSAAISQTRTPGDFDARATAAIQAAITAGQYATNGVVFDPFRIVMRAGQFNNIWNSQRGDTDVTFFQFNGAGPYLALGDVAAIGSLDPGGNPVKPGGQLLFGLSDSDPTALAHPIGAEWILDDAGSGNSRNISYYRLIAPGGYTAVGVCFTNGDAPALTNYWCVKNKYLRSVSSQGYWNDSGQRWRHHDGNLNVPSFAGNVPAAPPGQMILTPPTFLSTEGGTPAFALAMATANLPLTAFDPPDPAFDSSITDGDTTTCGITAVKIVPFTAVDGDSRYLSQSTASPFYYIAAEPYWLCTNVLSTPKGGTRTVSVTVGTSKTESESFTDSTSLSVSAEFGVEYGPASGKVSVTYTHEFSLTRATSETHDTQVVETVAVNLPEQPRTWVWERQTQIAVFRDDLTELAPVSYGNNNQMFIPAGKVVEQ
ncbi:MAG TPA: hypothetical protein VEK57_23740 [Thermoanaerobaculia bacterium]|nr:hypothetical protein [Thermoanaerobaculia bacterium]